MQSQAPDNPIVLTKDSPIALLQLNDPSRLNALSRPMQAAIMEALDELEEDPDIRVVILHGAGRAFSAGYEIGEDGDTSDWTALQWKRALESIWPFSRRIWSFRKPMIAAVHGYCLAGACEIAMLCDITIASDDCRFGEPEIRFGTGSTLIMPWLVPMKIAKELLYTGELISAQRAYEIGMVNELSPADQLLDTARRWAGLMSQVAPAALELTKEGINRTYEAQGLMQALNYHDNLVSIMDSAKSEEYLEFKRIMAESGLRAALDWRDRKFGPYERQAR